MSLPKRLYDLFRELQASDLVQSKSATDENLLAFANLLNSCNPADGEETAHRNIVRGMYYSNPVGFLKYIGQDRNRVGALVLYTESKCIAKNLNLKGVAHIKWDETTHIYSVTKYVPREQRPDYVAKSDSTAQNGDISTQADANTVTDSTVQDTATTSDQRYTGTDSDQRYAQRNTYDSRVPRGAPREQRTRREPYVPPRQAAMKGKPPAGKKRTTRIPK